VGLSLFLIRHEDAQSGTDLPDAHRSLTAIGRNRMRATAALFAKTEGVDVIFTSPLVRAVQTAEIFAAGLGFDEPIYARNLVAEPPTVEAFLSVLDELDATQRRVAIIGHQPTLSYVASHLLGARLPRSFSLGMILGLDHDLHTGQTGFRFLIDGEGPALITTLP
jgi:phosphohistidine phosphatase